MKLFKKVNLDFITDNDDLRLINIDNFKKIDISNFIRKNIGYMIFVAALTIAYITNRYHAEKIVRGTSKMEIKLKELKSEHIAIASELMQISKQSEVAKRVRDRNINLEEATEAPIKIETIE